MIVTVTANPAIDRLIRLDRPLARGAVMRSSVPHDDPGGKGINVARVLASAQVEVTAVLPGAPGELVVQALKDLHLTAVAVPIGQALRVNLTLAEPDGTTTKINSPGPRLSKTEQRELTDALVTAAAHADWVVMSGSLPPGLADHWYGELTALVRGGGARVALDTSGKPLSDSLKNPDYVPDLIKPNGSELADLVGGDVDHIERDPRYAAQKAGQLREATGLAAILLTLGGSGAVLVTEAGAWFAAAPAIKARSTVGAGDSSLAGFLLAEARGQTPPECLASAVAHGSAAARMPGSSLPAPDDVADLLPAVVVEQY